MTLSSTARSTLAVAAILAVGMPAWWAIARNPTPPAAPPRDTGPIPVATRRLAPVALELSVEAYGTLLAAREVPLTLEVAGRIERVHPAWDVGTAVARDDVLVALEDLPFELGEAAAQAGLDEVRAEVAAAAVEHERARAARANGARRVALARVEFERAQELARVGSAAESARDRAEAELLAAELAELDAAAAIEAAAAALARLGAAERGAEVALDQARDRRARAVLRAPFAGRLTARAPVSGALAVAGEVFGRLVDVETLHLALAVFEDDLAELRPGLSARVSLPARPELALTGAVRAVGAQVDPSTRSATVEVALANDGSLAAGQFARARIATRALVDALWIARREFVWREGLPIAFVQAEGARGPVAERRVLTLGRPFAEGFVVASGLAAGELLVVEPLDRLRAGARVLSREAGPAGAQPAREADAARAAAASAPAGEAGPAEPAPDEPAPDEPAPDEPAPDEPAPDEPAPDEPAPDEPAPDEPFGGTR